MDKLKKLKVPITVVCTAACIILVFVIVSEIRKCVDIYSETASASFGNAMEDAKEKTYNDFYSLAYRMSSERNHVENDVAISIDKIEEISRLNVYEAYDTEYVINKFEDNGYESWYEINGRCRYYVDLTRSEIIVDSLRKSVTVRIHDPEKEFFTDTPKNLLFEDRTVSIGVFEFNNGASHIGETDARNAEIEGREMIISYFMNNGTLDSKAKDAAVRILTSFVKEANIEVEDLTVNIEFIG